MKNLRIIFLVVFCISCKNNDGQNSFKETIDKQNNYKSVPNKESLIDFDKYFDNNKSYKNKNEVKLIGELNIFSNKIIACDPFYVSEKFTYPFKEFIPNGSYAVYLSYSTVKDWGKRVAFAKIKFNNNKTIRYRVAEFEVKDKNSENEYWVDSGMGCFTDYKTAKIFANDQDVYCKKNKNGNYYADKLEKHFKDKDSWANYIVGENKNVIIISSGFGDGSYTSYFGYDSNNKITCLITDFAVLTDEKE
jgi:hypothetical protein